MNLLLLDIGRNCNGLGRDVNLFVSDGIFWRGCSLWMTNTLSFRSRQSILFSDVQVTDMSLYFEPPSVSESLQRFVGRIEDRQEVMRITMSRRHWSRDDHAAEQFG